MKIIKIRAVVDRSAKFHRAIWGACGLVAQAINAGSDVFMAWTAEKVMAHAKTRLGHADFFEADAEMMEVLRTAHNIPAGSKCFVAIPRSIDFASMNEDEHRLFGHAWLQVVGGPMVPFLKETDQWEQIYGLLAHFQVEP
jgi:hypothetical protein